MRVDFNSRAGLVLQGVHTFLFSLSSLWPHADRFTSGGTPASEREKRPPLFKCGSSGKKTGGFFFLFFFDENNRGEIMDCNINSINNLAIETHVCYF